jgi:single-stranded-DNA-specific exonuclease
MKMNWQISSDPDQSILEQILSSRGLTLEELTKTIYDLPDESSFANIAKIAERIRKALYNNEPMVIFGHDDPDGITSTYVLYHYLESCGYQKHHYFIPNRNLENHGIQKSFLEFVKKGHYPLIITVDNGISAYNGVQALNELGCEVIITDHHLVQPEQIPDAFAILNPQLPNDSYPYKMLAGVGVVLMLIRYLSRILEHPVEPAMYFWTAVGSIADKVPMTGLNRIIIRYVIDNWEEIKDNTIDFLLRNYNRISSQTDKALFLQYCSRLIANGREQDGEHIAMRFLLQLSDEKVRLFQLLEDEKNNWESALNGVFKLIDTMLEDFSGDAFIYYDDEDLIPYSLLGTASTYVVNNLNIPAIFLKLRKDNLVCEGRCSSNFNMMDAFNFCKKYLLQYGGHAKAAGFSMLPENYNNFIELFNDYVKQYNETNKPITELKVDAVIDESKIRNLKWSYLEILLPFGQENPEPVIVINKVTLNQIKEEFATDVCGIDIPIDAKCDIALQWKNANQVKILDYRLTESETDI